MANAPDTTESQIVGYDEGQFQWENVHEESPDQITFDTVGDTLIAEYQGMDTITFTETKKDGSTEDRSFVQLRFRLPNGPAVVNGGYELVEAYKEIPTNSMTRTQLIKFVDTGQQSPMKSYRVDVAKRTANADSTGE
jgi:hypothetical protein